MSSNRSSSPGPFGNLSTRARRSDSPEYAASDDNVLDNDAADNNVSDDDYNDTVHPNDDYNDTVYPSDDEAGSDEAGSDEAGSDEEGGDEEGGDEEGGDDEDSDAAYSDDDRSPSPVESLTLSDDAEPANRDPTALSTEQRRQMMLQAINASRGTRAAIIDEVRANGGIPEGEEFDEFRSGSEYDSDSDD